MTNLFSFKGRAYPVECIDVQTETNYKTIKTVTSIRDKKIPVSTNSAIEMTIPYSEFMNQHHEPTIASLHLKDEETVVFHDFIKTSVDKIDNILEIQAVCKNYDKIYS